MAENKQNTTPERRPDCVTEIRMGNTVLVVSGFFKQDATDTQTFNRTGISAGPLLPNRQNGRIVRGAPLLPGAEYGRRLERIRAQTGKRSGLYCNR